MAPNGNDPHDPLQTPRAATAAYPAYLRSELRARRWSIRQLASRSGVDHSTITRLINERSKPTLRTAFRLQEALERSAPAPHVLPIAVAAVAEPLQMVIDALRTDPLLDEYQVSTVMAYYVSVRPPVRPPLAVPRPSRTS